MKSIYSLFVRGYQVNPTETNRKGLTELSEINLARPFLLAFLICIVFSFPLFTKSFLRLWISSKRFLDSDSVSLSRSHSSMISRSGLVYFFSTLAKSPESLAAWRSSNRSGSRTYFTV